MFWKAGMAMVNHHIRTIFWHHEFRLTLLNCEIVRMIERAASPWYDCTVSQDSSMVL